MSVTSFDDLLNIIQEDLAPCQNYVARDTVSATNKYVHTLRTRALYWTLQYRLRACPDKAFYARVDSRAAIRAFPRY
nr:unnamed protein product [Callosobruchus chinensis]